MSAAFDFDEAAGHEESAHVLLNGDYLCIRYDDQLLHVYRRATAGSQPHPFTSRTEYNGEVYHLAWIEEDKE